MKSRVLAVVFCGVALLFVFLLGFNFFYLRNRSKSVLPKIVTPVAEDGSSVELGDGSSVSDEAVLTSFVPLLPTETLMSTLTVDFDGDTFDDQVVAVRKAGSPYLFLIVGLYNPDTNSYGRSAEIATEISKVRTFSYNAVDMIGNHKMALVYQGVMVNGDSVMQLFLCKCVGITDVFLPFSRATPTASGGSQARGPTGATAAGLRHSHSHIRSEPCL